MYLTKATTITSLLIGGGLGRGGDSTHGLLKDSPCIRVGEGGYLYVTEQIKLSHQLLDLIRVDGFQSFLSQ